MNVLPKKEAVKNNIGIAGAILLTTGLFFSPALVSVGVVLVFLQVLLVPPKQGIRIALADNPLILIVLSFFAYHVIAGLYTTDVFSWLDNLRIKLPLLLVPFGLLSPAFYHKKGFEVIHLCLIFSAFTVALLTGINFLINYEAINQLLLESHPIPIVGGTNHIYFSVFLAYAFFAGLYLYRKMNTAAVWQVALIIVTAGNFILLHWIGARTGLLALYITLVLVLLYFIILKQKRYFSGSLILLSLPVLMYISVTQVDSLNNRYQNTISDINVILEDKNPNYRSLAQRIEAYQTTWNVYQRHPVLGTGMGDLSKEIELQYAINKTLLLPYNRKSPHNQYLSILAGLGIPGIILLLMLLIYPFTNPHSRNSFLFFSFAVLLIFSFLVESILERQLGVSFFSFYFIYLATISQNTEQPTGNGERNTISSTENAGTQTSIHRTPNAGTTERETENTKHLPLSIDVSESKLIKEFPTKIYLVSGKDGKFMLRVGKTKPFYKRWVGSFGFVNHLAITKTLTQYPKPGLRIPELVESKGWEFMLIRYIEDANPAWPQNYDERKKISDALLAFQTSGISINRPVIHDFLAFINAWKTNIKSRSAVNLIKMTSNWGWENTLQGFRILKQLKRFKKPFWIHRDFKVHNTLTDTKGGIYLIDFEMASEQQYGIMIDAVDYALDVEEITLDTKFLAVHIQNCQNAYLQENPDIPGEVRAAILRRYLNICLSRSNANAKKEKAKRFLIDVVLQDTEYETWYKREIATSDNSGNK